MNQHAVHRAGTSVLSAGPVFQMGAHAGQWPTLACGPASAPGP